LLNVRKLRSLVSFGIKGYLAETGWLRAFDEKAPVDADGSPLPWVTYSFIDFIKDRLGRELLVFEYGSGNSTFFYAEKVKKIVSVEHDKTWYERIKREMAGNAELIWCELHRGGDYCRMAAMRNDKFDIIIVDGRDRVNCCKHSVEALSERGVLVLDDSERKEYADAVMHLKALGFRQLSFSGISPGFFYQKATSVFYRSDNCLDI
jgi:hypothetical protein